VQPLSNNERRAWLRLSRTEHVGPVTFQSLIARFGSAAAALEELPRLAQRGGGKTFVLPDERDCDREWEALAKLGGCMIASCEAGYPRGLAALDAPPPLISVLGHPHLLQKEMIAIVGARNASALARKFADTLARGVVVVEAAERSGSLITAQCALEQGREIFAVPGSPLDPRAKGANRLIREGATLTESAEDILLVLSPILSGGFREPETPAPSPASAAMEAEADRIRARIEEALGPAPVEIDELIRQIGAPAAAVLTVILELELAGRCARQPGNRVCWL
jgi:predicted Rossmann fold nucleotide-binding protein DprA/Smf involved in DNA uptake